MGLNKNRLPSTNNNKDVYRYAGLAGQLLAAIGIAVFIGLKADQWLHTSPLFASALPLLVLTGIFYKLIRETSSRRKNKSTNQKGTGLTNGDANNRTNNDKE